MNQGMKIYSMRWCFKCLLLSWKLPSSVRHCKIKFSPSATFDTLFFCSIPTHHVHQSGKIVELLLTVENISSVVEFQRWWVLKSKLFGQLSTCHQGKIFKKFLRVMAGCQKVPKLYFQSQFWMSKINQIFSKKNFI